MSLSRAPRRTLDARPAEVVARPARRAPGAGGVDGAEGGFTFETMRAGAGASALVENTRLLAKDQLVRALRLTGAKLKDVRERAQGADGAETPRR